MKVTTQVNGKDIQVEAQILGDQLWVHYSGKTMVFANPQKSKKRGAKKSSGKAGNVILAPMPGKVTKVFCQVGDEVKAGQALVVMEAMKMEYTLKCEIDGKISKVEAKLNEQVVLGKLLVQLEATMAEAKA